MKLTTIAVILAALATLVGCSTSGQRTLSEDNLYRSEGRANPAPAPARVESSQFFRTYHNRVRSLGEALRNPNTGLPESTENWGGNPSVNTWEVHVEIDGVAVTACGGRFDAGNLHTDYVNTRALGAHWGVPIHGAVLYFYTTGRSEWLLKYRNTLVVYKDSDGATARQLCEAAEAGDQAALNANRQAVINEAAAEGASLTDEERQQLRDSADRLRDHASRIERNTSAIGNLSQSTQDQAAAITALREEVAELKAELENLAAVQDELVVGQDERRDPPERP